MEKIGDDDKRKKKVCLLTAAVIFFAGFSYGRNEMEYDINELGRTLDLALYMNKELTIHNELGIPYVTKSDGIGYFYYVDFLYLTNIKISNDKNKLFILVSSMNPYLYEYCSLIEYNHSLNVGLW